MTYRADTPYGSNRRVDPIRLWAGGLATALVAGGVAFVGVMVIHALFRVPGLRRIGGEEYPFDKLSLAITAAAVALLATGLLHLLMVSTPRAGTFFAWIMGIFVVAVIVQELLGGGSWLSNVLFSALYLVIGVAIASLLAGVARTAVKSVPAGPDPRAVDPDPRRVDADPRDANGRALGPDDQTRRLPPV
jgi:hypothetical protein